MRSYASHRNVLRPRAARHLPGVGAVLLSLWAVPALLAQATVNLDVQADRPYVNETLLIKLRVANFQVYETPEFPVLPDYTVQYIGQSSGSTIRQFGGARPKLQQYVTFSYTLIPRKAGELTIPAIPVVVDGKMLKTTPHRLTVRELPESPQPRGSTSSDTDDESDALLLAEITCAQPRLYVGQRANFALTIWLKPAEYGRRLLRASEMLRFVTGSFGPFDTSRVRAKRIERARSDGSTEPWDVIELPAEFIVQQPGPLSFDTVTVGANYPTQFTREIFGELHVVRERKLRIRPTVTVPNVQPLPTEGRPTNFSGAIGQFELNVIALPTNVRVGDPIQLTINITGGPVETLPAPDLAAIPELVEGFRVPSEELAGSVSGNRKTFTQTIRAKRPDVKEIPPIEFAYFDPERGEYRVIRSEPMPVLVRAGEQLDATDLTSITSEPTTERNGGVQARDALRGIKTGETELLGAVRPVTGRQVVLTTFAGPLVFICAWGGAVLARSRRDSATQRRRRALRNAERRIHGAVTRKLPPGALHGEIEAALAGYLADRFNEPPARFLGRETVSFLRERGVDQELVRRCSDLLERCEQAAYAGDADGDTSLADLASQCVKQLERERL